MTERRKEVKWASAAGYVIVPDGFNRYRITRGTRHQYLRKIDGQWKQTTKDGAPALKLLPPEDFKRIVEAIEGRR